MEAEVKKRGDALKEELANLDEQFEGIWKSEDGKELTSEQKVERMDALYREASKLGGGTSSYNVTRGLKLMAAR